MQLIQFTLIIGVSTLILFSTTQLFKSIKCRDNKLKNNIHYIFNNTLSEKSNYLKTKLHINNFCSPSPFNIQLNISGNIAND